MDEVLDIGYRSKISPLAYEFLVHMASKISYQESANVMADKGGSVVSANTVMRAIREVGANCKCEDAKLAHSLYINGVLPASQNETEELFVEADGTYVSLQNGKKAEVKALVAYGGKTKEKRTNRIVTLCLGHDMKLFREKLFLSAKRRLKTISKNSLMSIN